MPSAICIALGNIAHCLLEGVGKVRLSFTRGKPFPFQEANIVGGWEAGGELRFT